MRVTRWRSGGAPGMMTGNRWCCRGPLWADGGAVREFREHHQEALPKPGEQPGYEVVLRAQAADAGADQNREEADQGGKPDTEKHVGSDQCGVATGAGCGIMGVQEVASPLRAVRPPQPIRSANVLRAGSCSLADAVALKQRARRPGPCLGQLNSWTSSRRRVLERASRSPALQFVRLGHVGAAKLRTPAAEEGAATESEVAA